MNSKRGGEQWLIIALITFILIITCQLTASTSPENFPAFVHQHRRADLSPSFDRSATESPTRHSLMTMIESRLSSNTHSAKAQNEPQPTGAGSQLIASHENAPPEMTAGSSWLQTFNGDHHISRYGERTARRPIQTTTTSGGGIGQVAFKDSTMNRYFGEESKQTTKKSSSEEGSEEKEPDERNDKSPCSLKDSKQDEELYDEIEVDKGLNDGGGEEDEFEYVKPIEKVIVKKKEKHHHHKQKEIVKEAPKKVMQQEEQQQQNKAKAKKVAKKEKVKEEKIEAEVKSEGEGDQNEQVEDKKSLIGDQGSGDGSTDGAENSSAGSAGMAQVGEEASQEGGEGEEKAAEGENNAGEKEEKKEEVGDEKVEEKGKKNDDYFGHSINTSEVPNFDLYDESGGKGGGQVGHGKQEGKKEEKEQVIEEEKEQVEEKHEEKPKEVKKEKAKEKHKMKKPKKEVKEEVKVEKKAKKKERHVEEAKKEEKQVAVEEKPKNEEVVEVKKEEQVKEEKAKVKEGHQQHKHFEHHQHINLHKPEQVEHQNEGHVLYGGQQEYDIGPHGNEFEGVGHPEVGLMQQPEQQYEHGHQFQPPQSLMNDYHPQVPIKEQWIVPELHEKPASEQHPHGAFVIEDHSELERHFHSSGPSLGYREEIVTHPHGFGLTPSGVFGLIGAYSAPPTVQSSGEHNVTSSPANATELGTRNKKEKTKKKMIQG